MTTRELKNKKSQLTREINETKKEINWITKDDGNGRPIPKLYHGEPREPVLRKHRRNLDILTKQRLALNQVTPQN